MKEKNLITWEELVEIEPRLGDLLTKAQQIQDLGGESFCANVAWYKKLRPDLLYLVGWYAQKDDPRIRTQEAYELAYRTIYNVLPPCRNCICL